MSEQTNAPAEPTLNKCAAAMVAISDRMTNLQIEAMQKQATEPTAITGIAMQAYLAKQAAAKPDDKPTLKFDSQEQMDKYQNRESRTEGAKAIGAATGAGLLAHGAATGNKLTGTLGGAAVGGMLGSGAANLIGGAAGSDLKTQAAAIAAGFLAGGVGGNLLAGKKKRKDSDEDLEKEASAPTAITGIAMQYIQKQASDNLRKIAFAAVEKVTSEIVAKQRG